MLSGPDFNVNVKILKCIITNKNTNTNTKMRREIIILTCLDNKDTGIKQTCCS